MTDADFIIHPNQIFRLARLCFGIELSSPQSRTLAMGAHVYAVRLVRGGLDTDSAADAAVDFVIGVISKMPLEDGIEECPTP